MSTPNYDRSLERCRTTRHMSSGGTDRGEQCVLPTGHVEQHRFTLDRDPLHPVPHDVEIMVEARRLFLHTLLDNKEGRSAMIARSYVEEKVALAFAAREIWDLRAVMDNDNREVFDAALLKWESTYGV